MKGGGGGVVHVPRLSLCIARGGSRSPGARAASPKNFSRHSLMYVSLVGPGGKKLLEKVVLFKSAVTEYARSSIIPGRVGISGSRGRISQPGLL